MSTCSKYNSSDTSDSSDHQIHSMTSLGYSIISDLRNPSSGCDNMADSPQFQCKNHYNETLSEYDTDDGMHLKVTDLYMRDQSNFNNSANENLDRNNSIQYSSHASSSLDITIPNKLKSTTSSKDKSDIEKSCPYQADAFPEIQSSSVLSAGMANETLAYVLEMLTDRTDTLLKRVMKLEGSINQPNEQHQEYIQATQVKCDTMIEEVRKQKEEIKDMMNLLKNCSVSCKTLTSDFSQLQSKLSLMGHDIQKIMFKTDQSETSRDSAKLDRAKNLSNRSNRFVRNYENKSKEIMTNSIQDEMVASKPLKVEPNKQGGSVIKHSLVDNSYIKSKIKHTIRCCDQKECHSASRWISADLTSLSDFSYDMFAASTSTTDCENCALLDKRKLIKKKPSQKSLKSSNALPTTRPTTNNKTTDVFCKCMGGMLAPQPPQPPVTQRSQSVQVSNMALGRSLMRSEAEVTQVICTGSVCPINDTFIVPKVHSKIVPVTRESKVTQTKERKRLSCLCCSKKQKS